MNVEFDIERFLDLSRAVDVSDIDWDQAARTGITDDEHRVLRYMADTEAYTILYMRQLLAGHTARDPEVTSFLSCWTYEEMYHGRAIEQFLAACGRPAPKGQRSSVVAEASFRETIEAALVHGGSMLTPHFAAVNMTWGALNEACTAAAYHGMARATANRELARLLDRIVIQERKHYAFYYSQACRRLRHPVARLLARSALRWFWGPVGEGVAGSQEALDLIADRYFSDEEMDRIERRIRALPGVESFDGLTTWRDACRARVAARKRAEPAAQTRTQPPLSAVG